MLDKSAGNYPDVETEGPLSADQIKIVQDTFAQVEPIAEDAAAMFYDRLFELDPKLRSLFVSDLKDQGRKLMAMIKTAVQGLNDLESIVPAVQQLGERHKGYGVLEPHYDTVAEALLWTLEQGLGDAFTDEARAAWAATYTILADTMKAAAAAAPAPAPQSTEAPAAEEAQQAARTEESTMLQKAPIEEKMYQEMVDNMPINVIICDLQDFKITYMNAASLNTLKTLEHVLPCKADELVGQCIDIFHKDPSHQRSLLANPANLPHSAIIEIGGEKLDLLVSAVTDDDGNYVAAMLTWAVVTAKLKADEEAARLAQMVEDLPINVMTCDIEDLKINYINKSSLNTLKTLEHVLPVKAEELLGQCIDIFHKDPSHQRNLLADPANLPHSAIIEVGGEKLDLLVTALNDKEGNYIGPMLSWSVITQKLKADEDSARLVQMIDNMPINVMMCEPENFTITYLNQTSKNTLKSVESLLPCSADEIEGACIDIFHENPTHQRQMLADPSNLPHRAKIKLGPETLDLQVTAINDKEGTYIGPMLCWSVVTEQVTLADNFEASVKGMVEVVASASTEMQSTAATMEQTASSTSEQATAVAAAAEEASANVQTVATAAEELSSSITEISRQVSQSSEISSNASKEADRTNEQVQGLSEASQKIGDVVDLINDIASQTNLLALNATIEAARAGEAGKGFAVVASEVKNLANQTAKATDEISAQIGAIQSATSDSVTSIGGITKTIAEINEIASTIAAAVEEQGAATQEIARNVEQAAAGTREVTENITAVTQAAGETGQAAGQVQEASAELSKQSEQLSEAVDSFLVEVRAM